MPKSRLRRRSAFTPPPAKIKTASLHSPRWLVPLMIACFVLGLLWVVVYYITQTDYPVGAWGNWNMAVGFSLIIAGFVLSTRWK